MVLVAPSLLSADFGCLADAVRKIEQGGGDWVHLDIMDGSFVPPISFGAQMVASLRKITRLPFDVHLMVNHPQTMVEDFAAAGADYLTIHYESTVHVHRVLSEIRKRGLKPGISIVPSTPVQLLTELLPVVDLVLVMSVDPGFGGQTLIEQTLEKVAYLSSRKRKNGLSYLIEVDGGINRETCRKVLQAGAEVLVAGSAVFNAVDPAREIGKLRCG